MSAAVLSVVGVQAQAGNAAPAPPPPLPDEGTTFNAWVADQVTYDDNIYRITSTSAVATNISPDAKRADEFNTISVGGQGQLAAGRQLFQLSARVDNEQFLHNGRLDNTSYNVNGVWNWAIGSPLSGNLGIDAGRGLASFSEIRYNGKDMVRSNNFYWMGRYQIGPHWAALADYSYITADHSVYQLDYNNFRGKLGSVGVEYATEVDDTFSLKYHYYQGRYPDNQAINGFFFNSDYNEQFPQFWVKYGITDKTVLNGNVGHLKRQYVTSATGEYTGIIWRVWVEWHATDKLEFTARSWHEVHAYTVSAADYFISTGGSVAPFWQATEKFSVSLLLSYEKQNYISNSVSADQFDVFGGRTDKINAQQLNFAYLPRDRLAVNFFVRHEKRKSSLQVQKGIFPFTYGDDLANVSVTYKFF